MKKVKIALVTVMVIAAAVLLGAQHAETQSMSGMARMDKADKKSVDRIIANWKAKPREVAMTVIAKYGQPHEATSMRLVWHNNGPWKMTELVNEEIPHSFPKEHPDMLKQTISYQVPWSKFDELAEYDGSVVVERTKGEISARCDKEEANFLALNLADEIVRGRKSVKEAREHYSETMLEMKNPEYTKGFLFQASTSMMGDADKPLKMVGKMMKTNK